MVSKETNTKLICLVITSIASCGALWAIIPTVLPVINQSEETKENEESINNLENNNEVIFPYEKVKKEEYIEKKQNSPEIRQRKSAEWTWTDQR